MRHGDWIYPILLLVQTHVTYAPRNLTGWEPRSCRLVRMCVFHSCTRSKSRSGTELRETSIINTHNRADGITVKHRDQTFR